MADVRSEKPLVRARALPNALVEPDGLLRLPRPPSSEGRVGELHAHRAAASRSSPRSRACPPECAGVRAGKGL